MRLSILPNSTLQMLGVAFDMFVFFCLSRLSPVEPLGCYKNLESVTSHKYDLPFLPLPTVTATCVVTLLKIVKLLIADRCCSNEDKL